MNMEIYAHVWEVSQLLLYLYLDMTGTTHWWTKSQTQMYFLTWPILHLYISRHRGMYGMWFWFVCPVNNAVVSPSYYRMVIVLLLDLVYIVYIGVYLCKCSFLYMFVLFHVHDPQVSGDFCVYWINWINWIQLKAIMTNNDRYPLPYLSNTKVYALFLIDLQGGPKKGYRNCTNSIWDNFDKNTTPLLIDLCVFSDVTSYI